MTTRFAAGVASSPTVSVSVQRCGFLDRRIGDAVERRRLIRPPGGGAGGGVGVATNVSRKDVDTGVDPSLTVTVIVVCPA